MRMKPKYRYIIFIAGNHDKSFDEKYGTMSDWLAEGIAELEQNYIYYLKDDLIELEGIRFYGMPWTPWFYGDTWAFNKKLGPDMQEVIDMIEPCDVLITHGPPLYTGDLAANNGQFVGCPHLKEKIEEIQPRLHICGHIHEGSGVQLVDRCIHVNASQLNEHYEVVNEPYIIDLP
jgi:Icc-related predicted phosphoesterase